MILVCFLVEETNKYMWSFGYKSQKKQRHVNLVEISSSNLPTIVVLVGLSLSIITKQFDIVTKHITLDKSAIKTFSLFSCIQYTHNTIHSSLNPRTILKQEKQGSYIVHKQQPPLLKHEDHAYYH